MSRMAKGALARALAVSGPAYGQMAYHAIDASDGEPLPDLIYEGDYGDQVVWAFADGSARFYIQQMAGVNSGRSFYQGWFVIYDADSDDLACPTGYATDHQLQQVPHWGNFVIVWPSDAEFVLIPGLCNDPLDTDSAVVGFAQ